MKRALSILFIFISILSYSQDSHYWTNAFGPKSVFLGGAVVGGVQDHSASYYNAAGLAFNDTINGLSINSTAYQFEKYELLDGAGKGLDLKSNNMQIVPLIITGVLKPKNSKRFTFGYFLVERDKTGFEVSARVDDFIDVIKDTTSPGNEEYVSQFRYKKDLHEMNAGFGIGLKLNDHFSIGLTNYGAYRKAFFELAHTVRLIPSQSAFFLQSYDNIAVVNFQNLRTVIKLGLMGNYKRFKFGLTGTSPSINIWGKSTVSMNVTYSNIYLPEYNAYISLFADDKQEIKSTEYKTPLSIAAGFEWSIFPKTNISVTAEWFDKVDPYILAQPEDKDFLRPSYSGNPYNSALLLRIIEARKSITNIAVGIEKRFGPKFTLLMGGRTNYNTSIDTDSTGFAISNNRIDLYHFSLGGSFNRKQSKLYVGVTYSTGKAEDQSQLINIAEPSATGASPLQGELSNSARASYMSASFILGYVYFIK